MVSNCIVPSSPCTARVLRARRGRGLQTPAAGAEGHEQSAPGKCNYTQDCDTYAGMPNQKKKLGTTYRQTSFMFFPPLICTYLYRTPMEITERIRGWVRGLGK